MKIKEELIKLRDEKIINSLFVSGGTITEEEAEKTTFIIKESKKGKVIYFLSNGKLNKITHFKNKWGETITALGYGIDYLSKWYFQHLMDREQFFRDQLLTAIYGHTNIKTW